MCWLLAAGRHHLAGGPGRGVGVLGAGRVQVRSDNIEHVHTNYYRNEDESYICMALKTDGLKLYVSQVCVNHLLRFSGALTTFQGFGSRCDGLGGPLTPYNGVRNLVLEKRMRLEQRNGLTFHFKSLNTYFIY